MVSVVPGWEMPHSWTGGGKEGPGVHQEVELVGMGPRPSCEMGKHLAMESPAPSGPLSGRGCCHGAHCYDSSGVADGKGLDDICRLQPSGPGFWSQIAVD